ncbi:MAG: DUF11 domain-containing protein [Candidatus Peribacteria bacterium]|nr:DUF11 domain-containing protein [Candidatus Peribacteria bacterium]
MTLDEHFTLSSATTGYTLSGKQLVWDIGTLPINTSGTMQLQLQVANNPLLVEDNTPLVLTASLTSQTTELNLADNLATAQTLPLQ